MACWWYPPEGFKKSEDFNVNQLRIGELVFYFSDRVAEWFSGESPPAIFYVGVCFRSSSELQTWAAFVSIQGVGGIIIISSEKNLDLLEGPVMLGFEIQLRKLEDVETLMEFLAAMDQRGREIVPSSPPKIPIMSTERLLEKLAQTISEELSPAPEG